MDSLLTDAVEQFLAGNCDLNRVRRIEAGESTETLWQEVLASGFADALMAAEHDGAGLSLAEASGIAFAAGRHALPVPLPHTMVVRAALSAAGIACPTGPMTIASSASEGATGAITAMAVPYGLTAEWVLVSTPRTDRLLSLAGAQRERSGGHGSLAADVRWTGVPAQAIAVPRSGDVPTFWREQAAALTAALIAGAMERLMEMTVNYANDRVQFGKPIGKQQAIQQQISVMAEQVFASRAAALIGLSAESWVATPLRAAVAKARASEAVVTVTAVSHAVHGAIGATEEYDLQLFTRRLYEWRLQYGSESYWNARLGHALLQDDRPVLDFILQRVAPRAVTEQ